MSSNNTFFRGKDAILRAYRFNKVPAWGIFLGKDPMFSYEGLDLEEGEDLLAQVIDNLIECMGQGTYQLRIYKEINGDKGITNKTEYNYSFRFQLFDEDEYNTRNPSRTVAALQKRIEELEEEDEEEDNSVMGKIGRVLQRPEVEQFLIGKIMGWVNQAFAPKQPMPANMAGFTNMDTTQQQEPGPEFQPPTLAELYNRLPQLEREKFDQATYVLLSNDPQVGTNLLKLATLLQNNPATYQALTKM